MIVGVGDGLGRGRAGAVQGIGGDGSGKLGKQGNFPGHIRGEHRGNHLAEDDFVHLTPVEIRAILARRDHVVKHVDEMIAKFGEAAVLALP